MKTMYILPELERVRTPVGKKDDDMLANTIHVHKHSIIQLKTINFKKSRTSLEVIL